MGVSADFGVDVAGHPNNDDRKKAAIDVDVWMSADAQAAGLKLAIEKLRVTFGLAVGISDGKFAIRIPEPQFLPPAGASAELLLPGFSGGGYLHHDGDEWSGAVEARIGPIAVSGFAVLTTEEFSLLVLIAAEFSPPIQLSFGFTLVGVGGLIGINRAPDAEALRTAAHSGELGRLLFPRDAVAEAPRLLPVLRKAFPQLDGGIVVGPMLKLGWGTPTLVAATIGVLISNEGVIIVGKVAVTLPFEDAALIRLEAIVLGIIDSDGLSLDASLADSQIIGIPIEGDIGLRIRGGNNPLFAFSAGGFHPAFPPPDGMRSLRRVGTEISPGGFLRARLGAYLAVTSNSVQFGAAAELEAGIAGFSIKGGFAFDALIIFDPFGFMADFSAHVSVECGDFSICAISLDGHLSGPSPWRIRGHASISILFFDVDVDIPEITWGSPDSPPLPPGRPPAPVLAVQLADPANWTVVSRDVPHLVQLRSGVARDNAAVHPLSQLSFRQGAVPLNIELQRMDGRPLPRPVTLTLSVPKAEPAATIAMTPGQFPPAQFRDMDDKAKLSSSGYASFDAGLDLNPQDVLAPGRPIPRDADTPETSVLGDDFSFSRVKSVLHPSAVPAAPIVPQVHVKPFVVLRDPGLAVISSTTDLSHEGVSAASSHAAVAESLLSQLDVNRSAGLQVSREWEMAL